MRGDTQREILQGAPAPLLEVLAPSDSDAVAACVLSCVPRDSIWRRGKAPSAMARHPSSPSSLQPANSKSTEADLESPLLEFLLVDGDLLNEQGHIVGLKRLAV
jgi:hypothetical protein